MDRTIKKLAVLWCKLDDAIDHFFKRSTLSSNSARLYFLIIIIAVYGLVITLFSSYSSFEQKLLFFFGYLLTGILLIILFAAYYEKKRIKNSRLYPFYYVPFKWETVNYELLKFNEDERIDFNLLLNRRHVQNKINFRENNKSKEGANHRMLFSMFHVLIQDGIEHFTDVQKKIFFEMLRDSFLMNRKPINYDTLKSSFSNWKYDLDTEKGVAYHQYWKNVFSLP
ncbi:hypothetical protein HX109_04830 [Galbibacter sp. BG1]|uniref:hypothetical protein n=1 Tax=Galbibacter sp. BG1 TaxID=1170699 RepID=UPI0015B982A3|nr:hypothetical protein [Galbibacter sp. BG1]QLE00921.1 hypothetical protein HX109_04830 [Galbibacter sp. BG1]